MEQTNTINSDSKELKSGFKKIGLFIIIAVIIVIIAIAGFVFFGNKSVNGNIVSENSQNQLQKITLSFKNYNYYPRTITVKQGIPVEITLDSSIGGCFRSFNIKSLGVNQYSAEPSQTIKFTPDQKGSFEFACSMHMGTGTIIVE